jgi:hypothetical protein
MVSQVEYANDEQEATELLTEYSEQLGLPWGVIPQKQRDASVRIAYIVGQNNGLQAARKTIEGDLMEQRHEKLVEERRVAIAGQGTPLLAVAGAKKPAGQVLTQCQYAYAHAIDPRFTFGQEMTEAEYAGFRAAWDELGATAEERGLTQYTQFKALKIQDKAALGKAQVGDTLDTRRWQGNVFVTINGAQFNVHINIKKKK